MKYREQRICSEKADVERPPVELSTDKIQQILFWSFYFSRGSNSLQEKIFDYVALEHPEWLIRLSVAEQNQIANNIAQNVGKMASSGSHTKTIPGTAFNIALGELAGFLASYGNASRERANYTEQKKQEMLDDLVQEILKRDEKYLSNKKSHICTYALLEQTIALPEFKQMYKDIGQHIRTQIASGAYTQKNIPSLFRVIAAHNQAYPEHTVTL